MLGTVAPLRHGTDWNTIFYTASAAGWTRRQGQNAAGQFNIGANTNLAGVNQGGNTLAASVPVTIPASN